MAIPHVTESETGQRVHDAAKFCPSDPRFRHCGIHIRWITLVTCILQVTAISYEVASTYSDTSKSVADVASGSSQHHHHHRASRLVHTDPIAVSVWGGVYLVSIGFALLSIWRCIACFLMPQLTVQSLTIIIASLDAFLLLANVANPDIPGRRAWILLGVSVTVTLLESYFLWLGIRCYWYLRDYARFTRDLTKACNTNRRGLDFEDVEDVSSSGIGGIHAAGGRWFARFVDFVASKSGGKGQLAKSRMAPDDGLPDRDRNGSRVCLLGKDV